MTRKKLWKHRFMTSFATHRSLNLYEGRLQSSWTHLITPSRNVVEVRWRSLFRSTSFSKRCTSYNAPPTSRKCAADRWSLRNFLSPWSSLFTVGKAQKSHGARSELNSVFGLEKWIGGTPSEHPPYSLDLAPCDFWVFPIMKMEFRRQEISKWSTVCSTFLRSGWSVVRSASLAKGGTSKKRPSPHLHKIPTRSNKVSPRTFQTEFVYKSAAVDIKGVLRRVRVEFLIWGTSCGTDKRCFRAIGVSLSQLREQQKVIGWRWGRRDIWLRCQARKNDRSEATWGGQHCVISFSGQQTNLTYHATWL
jgi:hypothetical protein